MTLKRMTFLGALFLSFFCSPLLHAQNALFDEVDLYVNSPAYEDRARVRLNEVATLGFDPGLDALKFFSGVTEVPQLYCSQYVAGAGTYSFAVSTLPRTSTGITDVALGLRYGETGSYTIRINQPEKAPTCTQILLIDSISPSDITITDLKTTSSYTFTSSAAAGTSTNTRFKLRLYSSVPYVGIEAQSPSISCAYPTDTLKANATAGCTYEWTTGATTPYIVVNQPGEYGVTVTLPSTGNTATATKTITLDTTPPVVSITTISDVINCNTPSIQLASTGTNLSYLWSTGSTNSYIRVTQGGDYTLTVTSKSNGCSNSITKTITENTAIPSVQITSASSQLTCLNASVNLTATASNVSYLWSTGGTSNEAIVSQAGDYSVMVTDLTNGCSNTATQTITQNTVAPTVAVTSAATTVTCAVPSIALTADATNASYLWSTGATTPQIAVTAAGNYSVTATDLTNGCTASAIQTIAQNKTAPALEIQAYETELTCFSTGMVLTALSDNVSYSWSTGESVNEIVVNDSGNYTVTATDLTNGCTATASQSITQNITPPTVSITSPTTQLTATTTSIPLTAVANNEVYYLWSTNEDTPQIAVSAAGDYSVTVMNVGNGCTATATKTITQATTPPKDDKDKKCHKIKIHKHGKKAHCEGLEGRGRVCIYYVIHNRMTKCYINVYNYQEFDIGGTGIYAIDIETPTERYTEKVMVDKWDRW